MLKKNLIILSITLSLIFCLNFSVKGFDLTGLYVSENLGGHKLSMITKSGEVVTIAENLSSPAFPVFNDFGDVIYLPSEAGGVYKIFENGQVTTLGQNIIRKGEGLAFGPDGLLYVSDFKNGAIFKIDEKSGRVEIFVSDLDSPAGIAFRNDGWLYVAERNQITLLDPAGGKTLFVSLIVRPSGLFMNEKGNLYITEFDSKGRVVYLDKNGKLTTVIPEISYPLGLVIDNLGNLFITQPYEGIISYMKAGQTTLSTYAKGLSYPFGLTFYRGDGDGVNFPFDNCPDIENSDQDDYDNDKIGDLCDKDADGDGFEGSLGDNSDCNDLDNTIYPGADDKRGDGIDSNCNGNDGCGIINRYNSNIELFLLVSIILFNFGLLRKLGL